LDRKTRIKSIARARRALLSSLCASLIVIAFAAPAAAFERRLAFAVEGVVEAILVRSGQKVAKGTPLARLDLRVLSAHADAALAAAKASEHALELAKTNAEQISQLYDDLSTSKEELNLAQSHLLTAEADHATARAKSEEAAWRLERGTLTAPVNGRVNSVTGYIGLVVNPAARFTPVIVMD